MKRRCLVSVTDKRNLKELLPLAGAGWEFISTGGTATEMRKLGFEVTDVATITGFPEMLDGRVKTLHPKVHAGILAERNKPEHMTKLVEWSIQPIDMVVVNLYAFAQKPSIDEIDIGGPALLRGAAKNGRDVIVLVRPEDYGIIVHQIISGGEVSQDTRETLGLEVFRHTAGYDAAIADWWKAELEAGRPVYGRAGPSSH